MDALDCHPRLSWVLCAMVSVAAVLLLFQLGRVRTGTRSVVVMDTALVMASVLVVVLLACRSSSNASTHAHEPFTADTPPATEDGAWIAGLVTKGALVTYVSSFDARSYAGSGSVTPGVWHDIASLVNGSTSSATLVAAPPPTCPIHKHDFSFNTSAPVWSNDTGFSLSGTTLSGPNSMDIFPTTTPYTVFCLFQMTGLHTAGTLLSIPANGSPLQNGLTVGLSPIDSNSSIRAQVSVTVGNQTPLLCNDNFTTAAANGIVAFDTSARYLLTVTRYSTSVRASLFPVESSSARCTPDIILTAQVTDDSLQYNNQPITLNGNGALQGSVMAFGVFNQALEPGDESQVCAHYKNLFLLRTPAMQQAQAAAQQGALAMACPFDAATCTACASVTSWTGVSGMAQGGAACMTTINAFCTANPTRPGCECWDTTSANSSLALSQTCQAMRSMYSGNSDAMCAGPVKVALELAAVTANAKMEVARQALLEEIGDTEARLQTEISDLHTMDTQAQPINNLDPALVCLAQKQQTFFGWLFGL